jgi:hypothetical protein
MSRWNPIKRNGWPTLGPSGILPCLNPPDVDLPTASIGEQPLRHRLHLRRLGKRHMLDAGATVRSLVCPSTRTYTGCCDRDCVGIRPPETGLGANCGSGVQPSRRCAEDSSTAGARLGEGSGPSSSPTGNGPALALLAECGLPLRYLKQLTH